MDIGDLLANDTGLFEPRRLRPTSHLLHHQTNKDQSSARIVALSRGRELSALDTLCLFSLSKPPSNRVVTPQGLRLLCPMLKSCLFSWKDLGAILSEFTFFHLSPDYFKLNTFQFQISRMTRKLITASCLLLIINITSALQCYDCYGTGPDHKECNQERTCHGVACMICEFFFGI